MAKLKMVTVQRLMLDENNPRFRRPMAQDEAIAEFSTSPKTRKLAKHIAQHGLNPFDPIAVMTDESSNKFIVREGNRRTAAIKLLHNPHLAPRAAGTKYYAGLAAEKGATIPKSVQVVVIDDDREMRRWIRLKHAPDQSGVSTVFWQPWEKANFDDGTGLGAKYRYARELVNAALEYEWIDESHRDRLNLSTLSRVLDDEAARSVIGFRVDGNGLHTSLDVNDQAKLARRLIEDTGRGGTESSRTLRMTDDLVRYAKSLVKDLTLKIDPRAMETRVGSMPATTKKAATQKAPNRTKAIPDDVNRNHVVTKTFRAVITVARAADILKELRKIDIRSTPNAAAVLFRIFLEFSVMHYAEDSRNGIKPRGQKDDLNTMIVRVRDDLLAKSRIKRGQLALINKSISTPDHFLSVSQINQWVHNPLVHPNPREVNSAWNGVSDFLAALWADYE